MTLTSLITVNAVLAAIIFYGIVWLHAHSVRNDRRHSASHLRTTTPLRAVEVERDRIAA